MMSPEFIAILMVGVVEVIGLLILGLTLGSMLRRISATQEQITAAVSYNVLQGRRIEDVLREMRESRI